MSAETGRREPFVVGWEEWLALPDLGLPAIRAKIDTGAKTSSLHAFEIEPFGPAGAPQVRFGIHPVPGREDIARYCAAPIVDRREVASSNGDREARYVIRTRLVLGGHDWGEIETTLANRESMAYRMLLGRQALRGGMLVDPQHSFLQPRLSHKLYTGLAPQPRPHRQLRIALVASKPARRSNLLLQEAASHRGHLLDILPLADLTLDFDSQRPRLVIGQQVVGSYDTVLARATGGPPGQSAAVVRYFQQSGALALNGAEALDRLRNPFLVAGMLQAAGLPAARGAADRAHASVLVLHGDVAACSGIASPRETKLAMRGAQVLGLGMAAISIATEADGPRIADIDPNPSLTDFDKPRDIARAVIVALESRRRMPAAFPSTGDTDS